MQLVFTSRGNGRSTSILLCDWLFTVLDYLDKGNSNLFYGKVCELVREDIIEIDMASIFQLLVSNLDSIFTILKEAQAKREILIREDAKRTYGELYKEAEEFFVPLISMLLHPKFDKAQVPRCKEAFLNKVMQEGEMANLRLNVLKVYYDIFGEDLELLVKILKYILKCGNIESFKLSLDMVEKKIQNVDESKSKLKRELYLVLYYIITGSDGNNEQSLYLNKKAHDYLQGFFGTFASEDEISRAVESDYANVFDLGIKFLVSTILLPEILFFDSILAMPIYQYIKDNHHSFSKQGRNYQILLNLLDVCYQGTVGDFHDNIQNKDEYRRLLEDFPILKSKESNIINKLRLLTISTLAKGKSSIRLDELEREFRLCSFDTQDVVVNAISVGLIDGNISENTNTVNINCITKREFARNEWESLEKKIGKWITHLNELSCILSSSSNNSSNSNSTD
ncbi:PCI domain-containing protein [Cryptosporidium felis]|nr:PCI domain-containing protein [Cryptosporidium felis]